MRFDPKIFDRKDPPTLREAIASPYVWAIAFAKVVLLSILAILFA